jgi:hemolysin type calcium-binding protein
LIAAALVSLPALSIAASSGHSSAATAGVAGSATSLPDGAYCDGPCPLSLFISGPGTGRITSTPAAVDCRSDCAVEFDLPMLSATLSASPDAGSFLFAWDGCSRVTDDGRCFVEGLSAMTVCVTFGMIGSQPTQGACPPPREPPVPLPGPAPDGAVDHPPLGSPCTIVGSAGADLIHGTPGRDVICGGSGNDRIYGGAGHDLILGGRGNDRLNGAAGREHLLGGPGNDILIGGAESDELFGETGWDILFARDTRADLVHGGRGRDRARADRADVVRGIERRF